MQLLTAIFFEITSRWLFLFRKLGSQNLKKVFSEWRNGWLLPESFRYGHLILMNINLWNFSEICFKEIHKNNQSRIYLKEKKNVRQVNENKVTLYKFDICLWMCFGLFSCFYCCTLLEEQICSKFTKVKDPATLLGDFLFTLNRFYQLLDDSEAVQRCSTHRLFWLDSTVSCFWKPGHFLKTDCVTRICKL